MLEPPAPSDLTQTRLSRRSVLIGASLAAAAGVSLVRQPTPTYPVIDKEAFRDWIPKQLDTWKVDATSGVVLPPQDALSDRLYDNLATRVYLSSNMPPVMLLLAYNNIQDGVLQVHRPEICYPAGGFALSDARDGDLLIGDKLVPSNFFTATSPNRVEQVGYFTRVGNFFPRSWRDQRIAVIKANLVKEIPDAAMLRVSLLGVSQGQAIKVLSEFCSQFYRNADPRLQRLLIGPNA